MTIEVGIRDLKRMVLGSVPHERVFGHPLVKKCRYIYKGDSTIKLWSFIQLDQLKEDELWTLYNVCKNSWDEELNALAKNVNR